MLSIYLESSLTYAQALIYDFLVDCSAHGYVNLKTVFGLM